MTSVTSFLLAYALNALWQVPLIVGAAWLAVRLLRGQSLVMEHRIWAVAAPLCALLPACDADVRQAVMHAWHVVERALTGAAPRGTVTVTVGPATAVAQHAAVIPPQVWMALAAAFVLAVLFFAARLGINLVRTWGLLQRSVPAALSAEQAQILQRNARRFRMGHACVAVSERVFGPVTIGLLHPSILVPEGWLENVTPEDFEAALAHECAHIRRHDFARNLVFEVLALPVAWHPVLLVLRARLAESREMLCDGLAAEAIGGPELYARSLLRLASHLATGKPARTLHAIGIFDTTTFERRVMQLTHRPMELRGVRRIAVVGGCAAIAFGACASAFALRLDGPAVAVQTAPALTLAPAPAPAPVPAVSPLAAPAPLTLHAELPAPPPRPTPAPTPLAVAPVQQTLPPPPPPPAPPFPTQDGKNSVRISGAIASSMVISKVAPVYPPIARAAGMSGEVILHVLIGEDGAPKQIVALDGPEMLKGAALEAVKDWRWRPYLLNGQPTMVDTMITVNFDLND